MKRKNVSAFLFVFSTVTIFCFVMFFPMFWNEDEKLIDTQVYNEEAHSCNFKYNNKEFIRFFKNGYDMSVDSCFDIENAALENCSIEVNVSNFKTLKISELFDCKTESLFDRYFSGDDGLWLIGQEIAVEKSNGQIQFYRSSDYSLPELSRESIEKIMIFEGSYPNVESFDYHIYADSFYFEKEYVNHSQPIEILTNENDISLFVDKVNSGEVNGLINYGDRYFKVEFKEKSFPFYLVFKGNEGVS